MSDLYKSDFFDRLKTMLAEEPSIEQEPQQKETQQQEPHRQSAQQQPSKRNTMGKYLVEWTAQVMGRTIVEADDEEEAKDEAEYRVSRHFEDLDEYEDWETGQVEVQGISPATEEDEEYDHGKP